MPKAAEVNPEEVNIVINKPSYIESANKKYRFVIMECPSDANIVTYIEVLKKRSVSALVRACEPKYDVAPLSEAGITHLDLPFLDGEPPPGKIIDSW
jgi:protein tyrosine phosphatase type 4A